MSYTAYPEMLVALAMGFTFVYAKLKTENKRSEKVFHFVCVVAFVLYIAVLLWLAIFDRSAGSQNAVYLKPFASYNTVVTVYACLDVYKQIIDNVLVFIPFGILFPEVFRISGKRRYYEITALGGFLLSCVIEICQFIFSSGVCEADDIINNTWGSAIGCGFFCLALHSKIKDGTLILKKRWIISFAALIFFALVVFTITFYREYILFRLISSK